MAAYESPRIRRLRSDLAGLEKLRAESSVFSFKATGQPPQHYVIAFKGTSLSRDRGKVGPREHHEVDIKLGASYPRTMPEIRWLTPIYHPNISEIGMVCLGAYGTHWVPSLALDELCVMLWDMARYQNYDIRSPYNREAAQWAANQGTFRFPMDARPLRDSRAALGRVELLTPGGSAADPAGRYPAQGESICILDLEIDLSPPRPSPPAPDRALRRRRLPRLSPRDADRGPGDDGRERVDLPRRRSGTIRPDVEAEAEAEADDGPLIIDDSDRYGRLRLIPWWRQERLAAARVLVVGAGALGNEVLKNLALIGVGTGHRDRPRRGRAFEPVAIGPLPARGRRPGQGGGRRAAGRRDQPRGGLPRDPGGRDHRPRPRAVRRRRRRDRLPRQPRGPALGQPPVLEGGHALGRLGHPGNPGGRQGLRPARLGLLRMRDDGPRLPAPQRPLQLPPAPGATRSSRGRSPRRRRSPR